MFRPTGISLARVTDMQYRFPKRQRGLRKNRKCNMRWFARMTDINDLEGYLDANTLLSIFRVVERELKRRPYKSVEVFSHVNTQSYRYENNEWRAVPKDSELGRITRTSRAQCL
jgi:hypothetical protein